MGAQQRDQEPEGEQHAQQRREADPEAVGGRNRGAGDPQVDEAGQQQQADEPQGRVVDRQGAARHQARARQQGRADRPDPGRLGRRRHSG